MIRFVRDGLLVTVRLDEYGWDYAIEVRPNDGSPGSLGSWIGGRGPREHWWTPRHHSSPLLRNGGCLERRGRFHRIGIIPFIGRIDPPRAEQIERVAEDAIARFKALTWDWRNQQDDETVLRERLEGERA